MLRPELQGRAIGCLREGRRSPTRNSWRQLRAAGRASRESVHEDLAPWSQTPKLVCKPRRGNRAGTWSAAWRRADPLRASHFPCPSVSACSCRPAWTCFRPGPISASRWCGSRDTATATSRKGRTRKRKAARQTPVEPAERRASLRFGACANCVRAQLVAHVHLW